MHAKMEGYDKVAAEMAKYPEFSIFRTFRILNYRALLFKQSELAHKETRLISAIAEDRNSGDPERQQFSCDFGAMLNSTSDTESSKIQRGLMQEICHDLLLQIRQLHDLPPVHKPSLACFRRSLVSARGPRFFLHGAELQTWFKKKEYDLTSLTDHKEDRDLLSSWLEWWFTKVSRKYYGARHYNPVAVDEDWEPAVPTKIAHYPRQKIAKAATVFTTVAAPVLPTASAVALFLINDEIMRLGFIVMLSFVFSITVACVGVPRKVDTFVGTATFTAVLIVFISNNTGCEC